MSRFATMALAAALSVIAVPAFADTNGSAVALEEHGDSKKFPMPAAEFRQHTQARLEKARARMEAHISKKQLPEDKAAAARAHFNEAAAKMNEKVEAVCADGTVTKEEALEVRALAKQLFHHHKEAPPA